MVRSLERRREPPLDHGAECRAAVHRRTFETHRTTEAQGDHRRHDAADEGTGSNRVLRVVERPQVLVRCRRGGPAPERVQADRGEHQTDPGAIAPNHNGASNTRSSITSVTTYSKNRTSSPVRAPVTAARSTTSRDRRTRWRNSWVRASKLVARNRSTLRVHTKRHCRSLPAGDVRSTAMARVVVTGGAGFLGSHLCRALLDRGDEVVAIDNLVSGSVTNIEELFGRAASRSSNTMSATTSGCPAASTR